MPPPSTELMFTVEVGVFRQQLKLLVQNLRLFLETSSGITLSMLICK